MSRSLFVVLIFRVFAGYGQNLVTNPSFEDTVRCPANLSDVSACYGWYSCSPTPDYYNACNTDLVAIPRNFTGFQWPSSGKAYMGLIARSPFSGANREIIGSQLSPPLIIGKKYFVSFKASLSDRSLYACNNLGVRFSTNLIMTAGSPDLNNNPQMYSDKVNQNFEGWTRVSGSFLADSGYKYFMIGNFFADSLTSLVNSSSPAALHGSAYYYIDDVCISEDSFTCMSSVVIDDQVENPAIKIYPNPVGDLLYIQSEPGLSEISILDCNFRELLKVSFNNSTSINVEDLNAGIYFYQIRSESGLRCSGKFLRD
jgi:hypothetical protein